MERYMARVATGSLWCVVFSICSFFGTPSQATPIINEILQNPAAVSDSAGEWFELYNPDPTAVDLFDWRVEDLGSDIHPIDTHIVIPGGGFLVLGRSSTGNGGVALDYVYGSDISLGNGADELILFDASGAEIDRVEWDGGPSFPDPSGATMALLDPMLDNNIGSNWSVSTEPFGAGDLGTPGAINFMAAGPDPDPEPEPTTLHVPATVWLLSLALLLLMYYHPALQNIRRPSR